MNVASALKERVKKVTDATSNFVMYKTAMVKVVGFEPTNNKVKVCCLTV